jgi:hypothetical protein
VRSAAIARERQRRNPAERRQILAIGSGERTLVREAEAEDAEPLSACRQRQMATEPISGMASRGSANRSRRSARVRNSGSPVRRTSAGRSSAASPRSDGRPAPPARRRPRPSGGGPGIRRRATTRWRSRRSARPPGRSHRPRCLRRRAAPGTGGRRPPRPSTLVSLRTSAIPAPATGWSPHRPPVVDPPSRLRHRRKDACHGRTG